MKRLSFNNLALSLVLILGVVLAPRIFAVPQKISNDDKFVLGKSFFDKPWVAFPASTAARDGLGPLFNQNACANCHPKGGRSDNKIVKLDNPNGVYGVQINTHSTGNVAIEAKVEIDYQARTLTYANGDKVMLRKPVVRLSSMGYGDIDSAVSVRISPSLHGLGLLEAVPNKPINRFNLSASEPSILTQAANAAHNDMGLTNPLHPNESCSKQQLKCNSAPKSEGLDLPMHRLEAIAYFVRSLDKVSAVKPIKLFSKTGCDTCHTPSYILPKQSIYPYTDLLTHDLGEGNFRTAPLWNSKKSPNFWHDGRANTVEEAILWHNGKAHLSKEKFINLSKKDRVKLIKFIESL